MAYGSNADDDYHSLGMYGLINGVQIKIGEKFKLPERISLPIDWEPSDPSELLQFEYNFWKENEVIRKAEEERLTQVQMKNNFENTENSNPEISTETENATAENNESEDEEISPNTSSESNVNEILTPLAAPSGVSNKSNEIPNNKINVEEFEDQNQNPFELVELQTIDDYDELSRVLEPDKKAKKIIKSKTSTSNDYENFELDANFFNNKIDLAVPVTTVASILNYTENQTNTIITEPVTLADDFNLPENIAKGTLNWTKFNKDTLPSSYHGNDPSHTDQMYAQSISQLPMSMSNMQINGQMSIASSTSNASLVNSVANPQQSTMNQINVPPGMMSQSASNLSNTAMSTVGQNETNLSYGQRLFMTDDIPRTKSMPELEGMNEIGGPTNETYNNNQCPIEPNQLRFNVDNTVRTDRIDSIMKQYQFQRLSNMPAGNIQQQQGMPTSASNYNPSSTVPMSSMGGNLPYYSGIPGPNQPSNPTASSTSEGYPVPPHPFLLQDGSIAGNMSSHSISSPVNPSAQLSFTQVPTSSYNMQGMMNTGVNPFAPGNINNPGSPMFRHGVLPPLPSNERNPNLHSTVPGFNPAATQPMPYNPAFAMPGPSPLPPLTVANDYLHGTDIRSSHSPVVPKIPTHESYNPNMNGIRNTTPPQQPSSSSWLVDPTEDLPANQKNFAFQIAAMGFSLPCVARTVMRLGIDEKEVLDFLCSVQDLKEKDYHSDDVEMALLNLQNDKEKLPKYLELVNTLRELGFKPSEIHNALLQTSSLDQNEAIDFLTSSR